MTNREEILGVVETLRSSTIHQLTVIESLYLRLQIKDAPERSGPIKAIRALLRERSGITRRQILATLEHRVKTTSSTPRQVLTAAISRGVKDREFYQDSEGCLFLRTDEEEDSED